MSTKPQSFGDLADVLSKRLYGINATMQLCAFASEARRVLEEIDQACAISPELNDRLKNYVEAPSEWICHNDSLSEVLKDLSQQIESVTALLNDTEVHDAIRS